MFVWIYILIYILTIHPPYTHTTQLRDICSPRARKFLIFNFDFFFFLFCMHCKCTLTCTYICTCRSMSVASHMRQTRTQTNTHCLSHVVLRETCHIWLSNITYQLAKAPVWVHVTYVWFMSRTCKRHVTYDWVMSHICPRKRLYWCMSRMNASRDTYKGVPSHVWKSHVTNIKQTWHT